MYVLIADDTVSGYTSTDSWQPALYDYQLHGANVLWLTFLNPNTMTLPPAMINLAHCRGSGQSGCPMSNQTIIISIGGEAYSNDPWPWLESADAAQSMAGTVSQWPSKYNIDGIDLDLESPAGNSQTQADNLLIFVKTLKQLNPWIIVTLPVYGYPQVTSENYMVNNAFTASGNSLGLVDSVGIMVYQDLQSLQYVKNYENATSQWEGFPITSDVPPAQIFPGIQGSTSSSAIQQMASSVDGQSLGGFMVWFASVWDSTRNKAAFSYGYDDASNSKSDAWAQALEVMEG
jgi:hypothetical protein